MNKKQWLIVHTHGTSARISLWERSSFGFPTRLIAFPGVVGHTGAHRLAEPGSGRTPKGRFRVSRAYGTGQRPDTRLPTFLVTDETYFVNDPNSRFYGRLILVDKEAEKPFAHADHMNDHPGNRVGLLLEPDCLHPVDPQSIALFFCCGFEPTAGHLAADERSVRHLLRLLDPVAHPTVLIR